MSPRHRPGTANRLSGNRLLAALPAEEYRRLLPRLEIVPLAFRQVLQVSGTRDRFVYFPAGGVCSIIAMMEDGRMTEVAAVGKEGMIGVHIFFGADASRCQTIVQVPGEYAYVLAADIFEREMNRRGPLYDVISRYAEALLATTMQSAACNGLHTADQRCARWLLHSHDRVGQDNFRLTQEFLAVMLGVRRATVTMIAQQLQRAGLIAMQRRGVTILDRPGLEGATCECYGVVKGYFDRMFD